LYPKPTWPTTSLTLFPYTTLFRSVYMSADNLVLGFDSTSKPFFTKKSTAVPIPILSSFAAFSKFTLFPSVIYYLPSIILILQKYAFLHLKNNFLSIVFSVTVLLNT